ncbi:MAG TPA: hypothetical protein VMT87_07475 [Vicinamibacteria bacterium]|nr:hypothetical protein [Vicinamibacteria bacterium]
MRGPLTPKLLDAVERALRGDWPSAHLIVQEHEDDATANWIHAVCHRMEGDVSNARYWYARIGRAYREDLPTADELREIQKELGA